MNEDQYTKLCDACDEVLGAPNMGPERVAISWLHIIREHPVFLQKYECLWRKSSGPSVFVHGLSSFLRRRASWYKPLLMSLFQGRKSEIITPLKGIEHTRIDFLFISHLLSQNQGGEELDPYYGSICSELTSHGYTVAIVHINHTEQEPSQLLSKWNDGSKTMRGIFSKVLSYSVEKSIRKKIKLESKMLKSLETRSDNDLCAKVLEHASQEAMTNATLMNMRYAYQIESLVKKLNPKCVVTTYEGHAWERLAYHAARKASAEVKCVGYQHAAIFRLQHSIRQRLGAKYDPDIILTAGDIGLEQFKQLSQFQDMPIYTLGSPKGGEAKAGDLLRSRPSRCLVLPEGLVSECLLMFKFTLLLAEKNPRVEFVFRLHPIITVKELEGYDSSLKNIPSNVMWSVSSLAQDATQCRWSLYRGSTAIIEAAKCGAEPIYMQVKDELTVDPLYGLDGVRSMVSCVEEFQEILHKEASSSDRELLESRNAVISYCENYYRRIQPLLLIDKCLDEQVEC